MPSVTYPCISAGRYSPEQLKAFLNKALAVKQKAACKQPSKWQSVFPGISYYRVFSNKLKNGTTRIKLYGNSFVTARKMRAMLKKAGYDVVSINLVRCGITAYVKTEA